MDGSDVTKGAVLLIEQKLLLPSVWIRWDWQTITSNWEWLRTEKKELEDKGSRELLYTNHSYLGFSIVTLLILVEWNLISVKLHIMVHGKL